MKGRFLSMMKKWWMIAVVFALALSLTSCARRKPGQLSNYGLNYCDGSMGQIDVYTVAVNGQPGMYKIILVPIALSDPGDSATVTVVKKATLEHKTMLTEVTLNTNSQINAGFLTEAELQLYDLIAITTVTPGVDFLQANPAKDSICGLPLLGDGVQ